MSLSLSRGAAEGRRQRAVRRRPLEPNFDHIQATELPVRGSDDQDTPTTGNCVDADALERQPAEKNADDEHETMPAGTRDRVDRRNATLLTGGARGGSFRDGGKIVRRKQATGGPPRNGSSRSDSESSATVQSLALNSVNLPTVKRSASSVSLRSTVSSDSFGLEPSTALDESSVDPLVTPKYNDEARRPTHLKVLDGRSPNSTQGPAITDHGPHRRSPSTSPRDAFLLNGDGPGVDDDEDRRKSTSGDTPEDVQSAVAAGNQTPAAFTAVDFRVTQDDVVAHTQRREERKEKCAAAAVSGTVGASGGQEGSPPPDIGACAQPSDLAGQRSAVSVERGSRMSVVAAARRRRAPAGKRVDVLRRRSADKPPPPEQITPDSALVATAASQNGAESSDVDEQQTPGNKRFT